MKQIFKLLASNPTIWIFLRKMLEVNFYKQKKIIDKYFKCSDGETVLDMGCGTGEFSMCFPKAAYVGIDINPRYINYAAKRYSRKFLVADGARTSFPDETFTKIIIVGVLHHLADEDCERVLIEIKRVLKSGGKLLVMEDTKSNFAPIKLIQHFDQGSYIRSFDEWKTLLQKHFPKIEKELVFRNGLTFYSSFIVNKFLA